MQLQRVTHSHLYPQHRQTSLLAAHTRTCPGTLFCNYKQLFVCRAHIKYCLQNIFWNSNIFDFPLSKANPSLALETSAVTRAADLKLKLGCDASRIMGCLMCLF